MTTQKIQKEIINEFKTHQDWMAKYGQLIKLGKRLPPTSPKCKTEDNLIKGCQVKTWFNSRFEGGKVFYDIDSLSVIIRGIASLLLRVLDGQRPEDIKEVDLFFIDETGLRENFSPVRANSLWKLTNRMKADAAAYAAKTAKNQK